MKKTLLNMAISFAAFFITGQLAKADVTEYGFYVADVKVTSENYTSISSSKIEAWDKSKPFSITYTPSSKTLRMENVKIARTGSYNRALRNVSCDGLTIIFGKYCNLYAEDSSPVSLETNTTLKCDGGMWNCDSTRIQGLREDAIALRNDATLTIDGAYLEVVGGNSSAFWCDKDNKNKIVIKNSIVKATGKNIFEGKFISVDARTSQFHANATDKLYTSTAPSFSYTKQIYEPTNQELMYDIESIPTSSSTIFPTSNLRDYVYTKYDKNRDNYLTSHEIRFIKWFTFVNKGLTSVPFLKYFKVLKHLDLSQNELGTLDLSANTQLEYAKLYDTKLTSLNLSGLTKMNHLDCGYNELQSLSISHMPELTYLNCYWNQLTTINTSYNTKLETFAASKQSTLTSIDVTKNTKLTSLNVSECGLSSLDVTKNTQLISLSCGFNKLSELNLSNNTKLQSVNVGNNNLTTLTIPQNATSLTKLDCHSNKLPANVMQNIVSRLPYVTSGTFIPVYSAGEEGNICLPEHVNTAKNKHWTVNKYLGAGKYEEYDGIMQYKDEIAGVKITNQLCNDLTKIAGVTKNTPNASASYLPSSRTFQLNGVTINDEEGKGIFLDDGGKIELNGEPVYLNNLRLNGSSYTPMNFYIKGTGELILLSTLYLRNALNLEGDCMLYVNVPNDSYAISGYSTSDIKIADNAQLRAYSNYEPIHGLRTLSGGSAILPGNMYYDRERGNLQYTDVNNPIRKKEIAWGHVHQLRTIRFKDYTWPVDFEHGDYSASIYGNTCRLMEIQYSMFGKQLDYSEEYISAGDNVGIAFKVNLLDNGYAFYWDVQGLCDDMAHYAKINDSDTERRFLFTYSVPMPAIPPVKEVNINIPIPHDGESPAWDISQPTSNRDYAKEHFINHFLIDQIIWKKGDVTMTEGETFEMGEEYTVEVRVSPESGYQWHHNTAYIINNMDVPKENIHNITSTQKALIYNFGITDPDGINDIIADNKADNTFYTLDGRRIIGKPTQKGIYINKGKKVSSPSQR